MIPFKRQQLSEVSYGMLNAPKPQKSPVPDLFQDILSENNHQHQQQNKENLQTDHYSEDSMEKDINVLDFYQKINAAAESMKLQNLNMINQQHHYHQQQYQQQQQHQYHPQQNHHHHHHHQEYDTTNTNENDTKHTNDFNTATFNEGNSLESRQFASHHRSIPPPLVEVENENNNQNYHQNEKQLYNEVQNQHQEAFEINQPYPKQVLGEAKLNQNFSNIPQGYQYQQQQQQQGQQQQYQNQHYVNENVNTTNKENLSELSIQPKPSTDIDFFLSQLMTPRIMKISISNTPFQKAIFVLALKFFDKSQYFENFIFEWLDVRTCQMVGYVKCEYIKHIQKQSKNRFCIVCKDPTSTSQSEENLHYIHIEAKSKEKCELYVEGLKQILKYQEQSYKGPQSTSSILHDTPSSHGQF